MRFSVMQKVLMWLTFCVVQKAAANAFAQMLRRYTGLNHLAQAARTVLQNKAQVNKMHQDLCKVDFTHIQVGTASASASSLLPRRAILIFFLVFFLVGRISVSCLTVYFFCVMTVLLFQFLPFHFLYQTF